jgi:bifunctional N-acetylglucosamine-1-phosphate-uridyltransferase/glucosamine-1-phosphate-acetyltransferase GlmU-like protein
MRGYCFRVSVLRRELFGVGSSNAQGEIYLTDLIERLSPEGEIFAHEVGALEVEGVNTPEQLARLQHFVQVQRG